MQPWAEYQNNLNMFRPRDCLLRRQEQTVQTTTELQEKYDKICLFICCAVQENAVLSGLPYFLMWTGTTKLPTGRKFSRIIQKGPINKLEPNLWPKFCSNISRKGTERAKLSKCFFPYTYPVRMAMLKRNYQRY